MLATPRLIFDAVSEPLFIDPDNEIELNIVYEKTGPFIDYYEIKRATVPEGFGIMYNVTGMLESKSITFENNIHITGAINPFIRTYFEPIYKERFALLEGNPSYFEKFWLAPQELLLFLYNINYTNIELIFKISRTLGTKTVIWSSPQQPTKFIPVLDSVIKPDEECGICLNPLTDEEDVLTDQDICGNFKCKHHFHCGCVQQWLEVNQICPICRATFLKSDLYRVDTNRRFGFGKKNSSLRSDICYLKGL